MSDQMNVRINADLKEQFQRLAQDEGKSASEKIRELMSEYIKERDISAYVGDLWERTSEKFEQKGIDKSDIDDAIKRVRSS
ncbi:MAG: ribbon-helix-helix protein, CopG family [bacterium]